MNSKLNARFLEVIACLMFAFAAQAHAGVIATEFFNYKSGELSGENDSAGWSGPWKVLPPNEVVSVAKDGATLYGVAASRPIFINPSITDTGSVYIGFKMTNLNNGWRAFTVALMEKSVEKIAVGQGQKKKTWGLLKSRSKEPWVEADRSSRQNDKPTQMVLRIDFKGEGEDEATLYVDPDLGGQEPTGEAGNILKIKSLHASKIDSLRMEAFLSGVRKNTSGNGLVEGAVDDIVIATTWQDIGSATPLSK